MLCILHQAAAESLTLGIVFLAVDLFSKRPLNNPISSAKMGSTA
jgi:hypothetical protein